MVKQNKQLADSLNGLRLKLVAFQKYDSTENNIDLFYKYCLDLIELEHDSSKQELYKRTMKKLDDFVNTHPYMAKSYLTGGKKIYVMELPSGETAFVSLLPLDAKF